jgi:hypothetical protein
MGNVRTQGASTPISIGSKESQLRHRFELSFPQAARG